MILIVITCVGTVRTAAYAVNVANLVHPRRVLYVTSESLETVGYGISVAVLYLAIFQFLRTSEQPRPPHAKALSALPIALVVPTAALSVVVAPMGYAYLYERDDTGSNAAGKRLLYASYWVCTARPVNSEAELQTFLWVLRKCGVNVELTCTGPSNVL